MFTYTKSGPSLALRSEPLRSKAFAAHTPALRSWRRYRGVSRTISVDYNSSGGVEAGILAHAEVLTTIEARDWLS